MGGQRENCSRLPTIHTYKTTSPAAAACARAPISAPACLAPHTEGGNGLSPSPAACACAGRPQTATLHTQKMARSPHRARLSTLRTHRPHPPSTPTHRLLPHAQVRLKLLPLLGDELPVAPQVERHRPKARARRPHKVLLGQALGPRQDGLHGLRGAPHTRASHVGLGEEEERCFLQSTFWGSETSTASRASGDRGCDPCCYEQRHVRCGVNAWPWRSVWRAGMLVVEQAMRTRVPPPRRSTPQHSTHVGGDEVLVGGEAVHGLLVAQRHGRLELLLGLRRRLRCAGSRGPATTQQQKAKSGQRVCGWRPLQGWATHCTSASAMQAWRRTHGRAGRAPSRASA